MDRITTGVLKFAVNTAGRLSNGVDLCRREGLTSGIMLEYVYRNKAQGKTIVGKLIDRIFLSHAGWESIRTRKANMVKLLVKAIDMAGADGRPVTAIDVASGPALYVAEALEQCRDVKVSFLCRDLDERWLEKGRKNAEEKGISNIRFEKGDALDRGSFNGLNPDICVSSGFYDWFSDDEPVKESMRIIHSILKPGGYFVFSNQSGHADLTMVNEVFTDFNNNKLDMKTRPQYEVACWAKETGFEIINTLKDKWGYYNVTLARKK